MEKVVLASCVLHNYLRSKVPAKYTPPGSFDREVVETGEVEQGNWRNEGSLHRLPLNKANRCNITAKEIRDNFANYFNSADGKVPWQAR